MVEGKPVILIYHGKIDIAHLHQESISMDELEEAIREHGIDSYKNVKLAILEVDGNISVVAGEHDNFIPVQNKQRRKNKNLANKN